MIAVENLRFDYPGTRALDGISFQLMAGSVTALVGPNGAGKTTLLRCLAALDTPHGGRILIDGIDVNNQPRIAHQRLGFLPDHFGLYGDLSARRCLLYAGASHGLTGDALVARVAEVARQVGLADKLEATAGSLSRGQRQRLALAQTILHRPKVLLLDEPASGLDPEARSSLAELMRALAAEGMTLLVSSHILAELEEYCSGMLVLSHGRILEHRAAVRAPSPINATEPDLRIRRCLRIALALPFDSQSVLERCATVPDRLEAIALDGNTITASTTASDAELPQLLRTLLDLKLPVCGFGVVARSMQQHYLAAVRDARAP